MSRQRHILFVAIAALASVARAQMQDGQDYSASTSTPAIGRSPWLLASSGAASPGSTSFIGIYAGNLSGSTTPALAGLTNTLNPEAHLQIAKAGSSSRTYYRGLGASFTNGSIYFSSLVNVSANPTTNDEVLGELIPAVAGGSFPQNPSANDPLTLHAQKGADTTHFNLGIQSLGGAVNWATNVLAVNTDYLVVLQFTFGAGQPCQLFINPIPGAAQPAANAIATKGAATEPANLGTILFWESSTNTTGTYNYDTMRADTNWANVTPAFIATPTPIRLLFLGNSLLGISSTYSNNIPAILLNLAQTFGDAVTCTTFANSGWELLDHATNALSTNAINSGAYDFVILQEQSDNPSQPSVRSSRMFPACRTLNTLITNHAERTMFYEHWGYINGDTTSHCNGYDIPAQYKNCDGGFGSFSAMNIATRQGYALIANELGATISPVGLAWARVRTEQPALNLYILDDGFGDRHPNTYGAYLAACVFYSSIFGRSPEGSSYYSSTNSATNAMYLQRIAAETVLNDPFATDAYGFATNRFRWAFNWLNYTNPASAPTNTILISGAAANPSPSVKVDSNVGSIGNLSLGALDTNYFKLGQGRLFLATNGSLVVTGAMTVGKEGKGFVSQNGGTFAVNGALTLGEQTNSFGQYTLSNGTLRAPQILNGAGAGIFKLRGGALNFSQFGSAMRPLDLLAEAGALQLTNTAGSSQIFGNFTNNNPATLAIELGGTNSCLSVSGAAALGGTLRLNYANGFLPASGQKFTLLSAAAVSGNFTNVILPVVGTNGLGLVVSLTATSVVASVSNFAAQLTAPVILPNGNFQFGVGGISGSNYAVQTSTNLVTWLPLQTNPAAFIYTATNSTGDPPRFYRAVYLP